MTTQYDIGDKILVPLEVKEIMVNEDHIVYRCASTPGISNKNLGTILYVPEERVMGMVYGDEEKKTEEEPQS